MDRKQRSNQSGFEAQTPKKLKSGSGDYKRSRTIPPVLTSVFTSDGETSTSQYNNYTEHQDQDQHLQQQQHQQQQQQQQHEQYQQHHQNYEDRQHQRHPRHHQHQHQEHQQPHRSREEFYSPQIHSSQSHSPPPQPRRANTYPHFENYSGGEDTYIAMPPPRRSRSDHIYRPYPPQGPASGSNSPSSAFEAYPHQPQQQQQQQLLLREQQYQPAHVFQSPKRESRRGHSPQQPPHSRDDPQHRNRRPAPVSYVCDSARTCYPSTALGRRVRDKVRSMTEGTRLVPVARAVHHEGYQTPLGMVAEKPSPEKLSRGMVPKKLSNPDPRDFHQQQHQHPDRHHHHHPHPGPHPHPHLFSHIQNGKTIRLLNSTIDILETHSPLGSGTFSRITSVTIKEPSRKERGPTKNHSRHHLLGRRPRYYACKSIKEELLVSNVSRMGKRKSRDRNNEAHLQSVEYCVLAASQLAYEAHVLSCLDHPNIVKMRGLDADGILGFEKRDHRGFFLLMDILSETLDQKINNWRREKALPAGGHLYHQSLRLHHHHHTNSGLSNQEEVLLQRHKEKLGICLQLASALEYLHDRKVVYRDLKPSNIGFIANSPTHGEHFPQAANNSNTPPLATTRVQLFDFGLSRELTLQNPTLVGAIGTMRYMAPEVCLDSSYDCDCDIYSYSIVCWELWTQKVPFEDVATPDLYREHVCHGGYRPVYRPEENDPLQEQHHHHISHPQHRPIQTAPQEILLLLSQAWKNDPKARIRWPKTKNHLALLETLVSLRLEERELSESNSAVVMTAATHAHAHNNEMIGRRRSGGPSAIATLEYRGLAETSMVHQGPHPEIVGPHNQQHYAQNNADHHLRRTVFNNNTNNSDWAEPIRVEQNDSFSLRDEDLDVDLGI